MEKLLKAPADGNSSQARWLRRDLADTDKRCILAFTHRPLFASGELQRSRYMRPLYRILYRQRASVVLTAHSHAYERFVPQGPHGAWEPDRGLRQFVVGTGGAPLDDPSPRVRHSRTLNHHQHGVLRLELGPGHYRWRFLAADGNGFSDSGSDGCVDRGSAPR